MRHLRSLSLFAVALLAFTPSASAAQKWTTRTALPAPAGASRMNYAALVEELASHGFVVLAIDHPIGGFTLAPDGKPLRPGADSLHYPARPIVSMVRDWAIDDALVLRRVAAFLRRPSASVALDLDTTRVGVVGHSLAGRPRSRRVGRRRRSSRAPIWMAPRSATSRRQVSGSRSSSCSASPIAGARLRRRQAARHRPLLVQRRALPVPRPATGRRCHADPVGDAPHDREAAARVLRPDAGEVVRW